MGVSTRVSDILAKPVCHPYTAIPHKHFLWLLRGGVQKLVRLHVVLDRVIFQGFSQLTLPWKLVLFTLKQDMGSLEEDGPDQTRKGDLARVGVCPPLSEMLLNMAPPQYAFDLFICDSDQPKLHTHEQV